MREIYVNICDNERKYHIIVLINYSKLIITIAIAKEKYWQKK